MVEWTSATRLYKKMYHIWRCFCGRVFCEEAGRSKSHTSRRKRGPGSRISPGGTRYADLKRGTELSRGGTTAASSSLKAPVEGRAGAAVARETNSSVTS